MIVVYALVVYQVIQLIFKMVMDLLQVQMQIVQVHVLVKLI